MTQAINIVAAAANIKTGDNPAYTITDFEAIYPQFKEIGGSRKVPAPIIEMYLALAHTCVKEARWHDYWEMAIGLYVAHFCTLWLQGTADPAGTAGQVIAAGQARGVMTSKSVGDVSVSYDFGMVAEDLNGWAAWKLTSYGQQLATFGRLVGKGGMYIY